MKIIVSIIILISFSNACTNSSNKSAQELISYNHGQIKFIDGVCYYGGNPFTGILHNNKNVNHNITEQIYKDGLREGKFTEWFKDKTLKTEMHFKDNLEEGIQKGYHYNGHLSYSYFAVKGKIHGKYVEYFPTGTIQIEEEYDMDSIVSSKKVNIDGYVELNYHIKNNRKYGLTTSANCKNIFKNTRAMK